jgi:hypothetical protein
MRCERCNNNICCDPHAADDPSQSDLPQVELFCNPNAHASAFDAKVLVTVRASQGVHVVSEATLENVRASLSDLLNAMRASSSK